MTCEIEICLDLFFQSIAGLLSVSRLRNWFESIISWMSFALTILQCVRTQNGASLTFSCS
jgi:hypothetical protein